LAEDAAAGKTDPRRLASLSADNDVRGIDFASSKRDAHRRRSIMTRGRRAYYCTSRRALVTSKISADALSRSAAAAAASKSKL